MRTNKPMPPRGSTLWERVLHYGWTEVIRIPELGPCWETEAPLGGAYHRIAVGKAAAQYVHRIAYEHFVGPIPADLILRHACDNVHCVNPEHLMPGTQADNMRDRTLRGRTASKIKAEDLPEIRRRIALGEKMVSIARDYGVSGSAVSKIRDGATWKWL